MDDSKLISAFNSYLDSDFYVIHNDQEAVRKLSEGTVISFGNDDFCRVEKVDGENYARSGRYGAVFVEPLSLITLFQKIWVKKSWMNIPPSPLSL